MKKIYIIILLLFLFFGLSGCKPNNQTKYSILYYQMDLTFGDLLPQVWIIVPKADQEKYPDLGEELSEITNRLDELYSPSRDDSLISQINKKAGIEPVQVTQELIDVLKVSKEISALSEVDGVALYDVSIMPVVDLWDINNLRYSLIEDFADIPEDEDIKSLLSLVNYKNILIDEENLTIFLKEVGMKIDLGSILKGYAADQIKQYLTGLGVQNALIDVAGNLYVMGQNLSKGKLIDWEIYIQTPYVRFGDKNSIGHITKNNITAVTSGSYERYILTENFEQYHHILDPRTGYPSDSDLMSVSIITTNSMRADALSTAMFCLGLDRAYEVIEGMKDTEAIFITNDKKIYVTSGLKDNYQFNEATMEIEYEYKGVKNGTSN